jgi:hypothetical protein
VSRAAALAALGTALLGAAGCFDVRTVDAVPLVIDDFDDGDLVPADSALPMWTCFNFNPSTPDGFTCGHDIGYQSDYSLFLQATITDPPDKLQQNGGAGVATFGDTPQDFSRFRELVLSVALEYGDPPLLGPPTVHVDLGCSTARADDGTVHNDLTVIQDIDPTTTWQTLALPMGSFGTPFYLPTHIVGGPTACLQRVDSVQVVVDANLPDGQSGSFTLHVDDIFFR